MGLEECAQHIPVKDLTIPIDLDKLNYDKKLLLNFIHEEIKESCEWLEFKIEYCGNIRQRKVYKKVTFYGAARMIQEKVLKLVEKNVEDALRFSELLIRCEVAVKDHDLRLTGDEEIEFFNFFETYSSHAMSIKKINYGMDFNKNIVQELI